jgi:UDP-glucose 4-epimerase
MRYLITGGAGFIGSHLSDLLIARGDEVHVLDDLSTGRLENVEHLGGDPAFGATIASVNDRQAMAALVAQSDAVVHLAAAVGVRLVVERPVHAIETNVHCTEVVLALADQHRKPVLLASTSEVYGKSDALPFKEDGDLQMGATDKARWAYACSKAIDEFLAMAYWRERGLPITVARLFNTVGPRQTGQYGMVVPTFVKQALTARPITIHGDGRQSRCFTDVSDVVGALLGLMDHPGAVGEVFNVGSGEEVAIEALAGRIRELTASSSEIVYIPYEAAYGEGFEDMPRRVPDISKIHALLGYRPRKSLDQILDGVIGYFRDSPTAPACPAAADE